MRLCLSFAAICMVATPSASQTTRELPAGNLGTGVKVRVIPLPKPVVRIVEREVIDVPESLLEFGKYTSNAQMTVSRAAPRPPTSPGSISPGVYVAAYIKRTAIESPRPDSCQISGDRLSLSAYYRNGFTVSRVDIRPIAPRGTKLRQVADSRFYSGYGDRAKQVPPSAMPDRLVIGPPVSEFTSPRIGGVPPRTLCHSEYYLRLWLRGPEGIDPLTGRRLPKPAQVN